MYPYVENKGNTNSKIQSAEFKNAQMQNLGKELVELDIKPL